MGALVWDGHQPSIELKRKLAAYGELVVKSTPQDWSWTFERAKRWYSGGKREAGAGYDTLMDAIEPGLTAAMLLVREACGVRDMSRRAALDDGWAERYPLPMAKERANLVERLGTKKACACKKRAEVPATVGPPEGPVVSDDPLFGKHYDRMPRERGESVHTYARRLVTEASARAREGHYRVARELLDEDGRVAAGLSRSKAARLHEHVDHVRGKLEGTPPAKGAKPRPARPVRTRSPAPQPETKKDALLLNAFKDAVQQALSEAR